MDNNNINFNDNGQNSSTNNFDPNNSSSFGSSGNTQNNTENNVQNRGSSEYGQQPNENSTHGNNGYSTPNYNNQYNNQNYNIYGTPTYNGYNNGAYGHQPNRNGIDGNSGYSAPNYNNQYNNQNYNTYGAPNYNGYNNGDNNQAGYNPNGTTEGYYYQQTMNYLEEQNRLNESNSTASTSLVFGIIGLVTAFLCCGILLTPLWAILAIVKGAKAQKLAYPKRASAKATVGKVFGIVSLAFTAFIWVFFVLLMFV